jgi:hypothetical protein
VRCVAAGVAFAGAAVAAPPGTSALNGLRAAAVADRPALSKLDLRPPADPMKSSARPVALAVDDAPFPSARRPTDEASRSRLDESWPSLASDGLAVARPMSRAQEMARRFQHEGLPVAKLFENHSALVSLGLNQHGKPGIWLIQKLP